MASLLRLTLQKCVFLMCFFFFLFFLFSKKHMRFSKQLSRLCRCFELFGGVLPDVMTTGMAVLWRHNTHDRWLHRPCAYLKTWHFGLKLRLFHWVPFLFFSFFKLLIYLLSEAEAVFSLTSALPLALEAWGNLREPPLRAAALLFLFAPGGSCAVARAILPGLVARLGPPRVCSRMARAAPTARTAAAAGNARLCRSARCPRPRPGSEGSSKRGGRCHCQK